MELDDQIELGHLLLEERVCRVCGHKKNLIDGYYRTRKNVNLLSSYSYECKECTVKRISKSRKKGILFSEYNDLVIHQNNQCAVCKTLQGGVKHNSFRVDHNTKTGEVRGLVCKSCSIILREVGDNIHTLNKMIEYLESHGR